MLVVLLGSPVIAFAGKTLADIMVMITGYFQNFLILIISFAIVTFVWNVYRYFFTSDVGGDKKKEAALYVMYSVIGFFVIFSMWGLVAVVKNTFNLPDEKPAWPFSVGGLNPGPGAPSTQQTAPAGPRGSTPQTAPAGNRSSTADISNPSPATFSGLKVQGKNEGTGE